MVNPALTNVKEGPTAIISQLAIYRCASCYLVNFHQTAIAFGYQQVNSATSMI